MVRPLSGIFGPSPDALSYQLVQPLNGPMVSAVPTMAVAVQVPMSRLVGAVEARHG